MKIYIDNKAYSTSTELIRCCTMLIMSILSSTFSSAQFLNSADRDYVKIQNEYLYQELESVFDQDKPDFHSRERKLALSMLDVISHHAFPHSHALKTLYLNRYEKSIASIRETKVDTGTVIWNVYNMAYIVKTPEVTLAFDLTRLPSSLRKEGEGDLYENIANELVDMCDILFVSHVHGDHADAHVAGKFISQNKPVIAHSGVFQGEDFNGKIINWPRSGEQGVLKLPQINTELLLRIYPGHQAVTSETAVDNNIPVITLPNGVTLAHTGDQSWKDDFVWLDSVSQEVNIDVLMVNTWTLWPDRLMEGLNPKLILPGHVNEMNHGINTRIPFWKSYQLWKNGGDKVKLLFMGEKLSLLEDYK